MPCCRCKASLPPVWNGLGFTELLPWVLAAAVSHSCPFLSLFLPPVHSTELQLPLNQLQYSPSLVSREWVRQREPLDHNLPTSWTLLRSHAHSDDLWQRWPSFPHLPKEPTVCKGKNSFCSICRDQLSEKNKIEMWQRGKAEVRGDRKEGKDATKEETRLTLVIPWPLDNIWLIDFAIEAVHVIR